MTLKKLGFIVIFIVAVIFAVRSVIPKQSPQYRQIDAFYEEVKYNPSAFPEAISTVVAYIEKARELKVPISRKKPQIEDEFAPAIRALLQQQCSLEEIAAYETWEKATGEASIALRYAEDRLGLDPQERMSLGGQYNNFVRFHFGAPTIGKAGQRLFIAYPLTTASERTEIAEIYSKIDDFYAEVESNPEAFPEEVCAVTEHIKKSIKDGMRFYGKWPDGEDPEVDSITALLRQPATPEELSAYEVWKAAIGEATVGLRRADGQSRITKKERERISRVYEDFTRDYFHAPVVGKRGEEYYLEDPADTDNTRQS